MNEAADAELLDQSGALVAVTPGRDALTMFGDETAGIDRARRVANMLKAIVNEKKLAVKIGKGEHLRVEAWCACASMVGVAPQTEWSREVRHPASGDLEGYEARVQVVQIATGQIVGAAEAGCFFDETLNGQPRWNERHAAKSMAQTRATSKAIGQVLRWIPVLAGFSGTPYEEMPPGGFADRNEEPLAPARAPAAAPRRSRTQAPPPPRDESADPAAQAFLYQPGDEAPPEPKYRQWRGDAPTKNPASEFAKHTWSHMEGGSYGGKRYQWMRRVLAMPDPPASTAERARFCVFVIENREHNKRADMAAAKGEETPF
jgi:hypothetical protein